MITHKKDAIFGLSLMTGFVAVLCLLFTNLIENRTPIDYLDNLYNSISKGSVYYIPSLRSDAASFHQSEIDVTLSISDSRQREEIGKMLKLSNMGYTISDKTIRIKNHLESLVRIALEDADDMFKNRGKLIQNRYNLNERKILFNWWTIFNKIEFQLKKQKMFQEANYVATMNKKAIECSYNYYQVKPKNIADQTFLVVASLAFYVIYTLWFGFAIMYLFKGLGLKLEH